ncbi:PREDICTED: fibropellin-3-like, partial [Priapulus caudatus]|uniref:Fibropellin-3-like n=1 Tax=Priapulus caudatus TaxID=37621 RepID=A0ABM1EYF6_PRICU
MAGRTRWQQRLPTLRCPASVAGSHLRILATMTTMVMVVVAITISGVVGQTSGVPAATSAATTTAATTTAATTAFFPTTEAATSSIVPAEEVEEVDHCLTQPCRNGGACHMLDGGYYCNCPTRYTGLHCEVDSGPLCFRPENQCLNNGLCREIQGNYTICACQVRFTGGLCETVIDNFCELNPCENSATCQENEFGDGYTCYCPPGFSGAQCENNIDDCQPQPCANGRCMDGISSYTCDCTDTGYTGALCQ